MPRRVTVLLHAAALALAAAGCGPLAAAIDAGDAYRTVYQSQSLDDLGARVHVDVVPASAVFERRPGAETYDYELTVVLDYDAADIDRVLDLAPATGTPAAPVEVGPWMPPELTRLAEPGPGGRPQLAGAAHRPDAYLRPGTTGHLLRVGDTGWFLLTTYTVESELARSMWPRTTATHGRGPSPTTHR